MTLARVLLRRLRPVGPAAGLLLALVASAAALEAPADRPGDAPDTPKAELAARPAKPAPPTLDELYDRLADAPDEKTAERVASDIEARWRRSDSPTIDALMGQAAGALEDGETALALDLLDAVVRLAPDYAEGWNRRAAALFQASEYGLAIADIERALALEPRHFGALAGLGLILRQLDDKKDALAAYDAVLAINPRDGDARKARDELLGETGGREL